MTTIPTIPTPFPTVPKERRKGTVPTLPTALSTGRGDGNGSGCRGRPTVPNGNDGANDRQIIPSRSLALTARCNRNASPRPERSGICRHPAELGHSVSSPFAPTPMFGPSDASDLRISRSDRAITDRTGHR